MSSNEKHYDPLDHEPLPEGVEAPPPLTHTMAIVRWAILIGISVFALIMILSSLGLAPWEARADDIVQYHCPMHPTYISNQPGECPICGMTLVPMDNKDTKALKTQKTPEAGEKKETKDEKTVTTQYVCPMHPEVTSDKPGDCPKCGMHLVAVSTAVKKESAPPDKTGKSGQAAAQAEVAKYVCPMHPEVTSDKPGDCPKCGMHLEPVSADSTKAAPQDSAESSQMDDMKGMPGMESSELKSDTMSDMGKAPVPGLVPITIEPERLQLIGIRTAPVEKRSLGDKIDIVGFVTPDETHMSNVNSRISGWVVDLFVDKTGQYVQAGEPLMSLYSQDLYQAEQDFMVARDALKNSSSDSVLMSMRRQIHSAARQRLNLLGLTESQIDELEKTDLPSAQMTIVSPFSGYVLEKNVLPGQYLSPNLTLFTIADLSNVWVLGDVYEQDIPYVHANQKAYMTLTAFPGEKFQGRIAYVYPSVSEKNRTLKVRLQFPNPSLRIKPGMYADVEIDRSRDQVLAVPAGAVLDGGDVQYAFVVHDGRHFEPRKVTVGRSSDDWVEILSGLEPGEEVVTSANFLIDSESRLKAAVAGMAGMPGMNESAAKSKEPVSFEHAH
jgi:RND family efflux transporter MFP subunit